MEKAMVTHSSTLAWKIPWMEEPGKWSPWGREELDTTEWLHSLTHVKAIMRNTGLEETQAGIKVAGRNINNLRYADDTTLTAESEEEPKNLLMKTDSLVRMGSY